MSVKHVIIKRAFFKPAFGRVIKTVFASSLMIAAQVYADDRNSTVPDFSGTYDSGTLTPLERPEFLGETKHLYGWVAKTLSWAANLALEWSAEAEADPDREAPPAGGDGSGQAFGAGNVGGYNTFWIDPGSNAFQVDGKYRTSIIIDPPNGRQPKMTAKGEAKLADNFSSFTHPNTGTAWWLDNEGRGPYDGPEDLALAERCLLGFSAGPPMLPGIYNNFKRIVQTEDHVLILMEMVHDSRIIRLNSKHLPSDQRKWLGDSIGWWEGQTLVVDTRNFREDTGLYGGDENLHLVERFSQLDNGDLLYHFTVDDPTIWDEPWTGEYSWARSDNSVYEYACHEANYAMGNILRGARILESEYVSEKDAENTTETP